MLGQSLVFKNLRGKTYVLVGRLTNKFTSLQNEQGNQIHPLIDSAEVTSVPS